MALGDLEWVRQRHRGKGKRTAKDAAMLSFQSLCGNSLFQVWLSDCRRVVLCEVPVEGRAKAGLCRAMPSQSRDILPLSVWTPVSSPVRAH